MQQSVRQGSESITRYRYVDTVRSAMERAEPAVSALVEIAGLFVLVSLLWGFVVFSAFTSSLP